MIHPHALTDRGNMLHSFARVSSPSTVCGSCATASPKQTAVSSHSHDGQQKPLQERQPANQQRSGVPVYVMLPLDTVSLVSCCGNVIWYKVWSDIF